MRIGARAQVIQSFSDAQESGWISRNYAGPLRNSSRCRAGVSTASPNCFPNKHGRGEIEPYIPRMTTLRHIHQYMTDRRKVLLQDGRTGKIVRVDTVFPKGSTTVSVWIEETQKGPGVAKVSLDKVLGPAPRAKSA
jgi:hypothetical protein